MLISFEHERSLITSGLGLHNSEIRFQPPSKQVYMNQELSQLLSKTSLYHEVSKRKWTRKYKKDNNRQRTRQINKQITAQLHYCHFYFVQHTETARMNENKQFPQNGSRKNPTHSINFLAAVKTQEIRVSLWILKPGISACSF